MKLTTEEAIKFLGRYVDNEYYTPKCQEAHQMAISALQEHDENRWIPVTELLPEENHYVLIWCGSIQVAEIIKGITEEERAKMKRGELPDPEIGGWKGIKRSSVYTSADVHGNNKVPYRWKANGGPMEWFGQKVTHWKPLPAPPKEDEE